ncbi:hypothetical protein J2795_000383 [Chryseobacterium bernardetii]|uniref:Uncharacterized protein n=2 Tax=Chryseobacterium TaxID=59732 RepID=A0A543EN80_9FLAO|nr:MULTISPECIES: hypothetical protein [Chryseobacterium]MDR6369380.1 hypothetical protein [Chryseobacterium vietnamense]MDR6439698.1 hypothetical protein [Chryseobacterium bernardetii]TQM22979.1 hypothetical protein FB551_2703 [Chryseobacterium aquifrigidense]
MKLLYSLALQLVSMAGYGQENPYWFTDDIKKKVADSTQSQSWRSQMAATYYSISGQYKPALESWDITFGRVKKLSTADSLRFSKLIPVNAKEYILDKAGNEQIVILNEAHHNASHRTFASSLLQGLYDKGYRYLGMETLANDSLNTTKFAALNSGYYSKEPEFGNFIYHALKIGFTLFPYEAEGNNKEREIGEAKNIFDFMQKNKEGKYLIYCGYQHAYEGVHKSWEKTMAGRLSDLTGINPFTIDQTQFSEKSSLKFNEPLLRLVKNTVPVVLKDENQEIYNGEDKELYTDIKIIHPVTKYVKSRPDWMLRGNRTLYKIPASKVSSYPALVLAYRKGEFEKQGIPADIIEVNTSKDHHFLILDKGKYEIVVKDKEQKITNRFEKTVK